MKWEEILKDEITKEEIKKGMLGDIKDAVVKYVKTRKFKNLTRKYIKIISGDTLSKLNFGEMSGGSKYPKLQGTYPSQHFDDKEWADAGEDMKKEVIRAFTEEIDTHWDSLWQERRHTIDTNVNYIPESDS